MDTRGSRKASEMDSADNDKHNSENPTIQQLYSIMQKMDQNLGQQMTSLTESMRNLSTSVNTRLDDLDKQIAELARSQDFISKQFDEYAAEHKDHKARIVALESENKALKSTVGTLQSQVLNAQNSVDDLEEYGRRDMLEITGIPQTDTENTNHIVQKICSELEVQLGANDISTSHRLAKTRKGPAPIIVKFLKRDVRGKVFAARKQTSTASNIGFSSNSKIYINESLTKRNRSLLFHTRQCKNQLHHKYVWTKYGKIFMRRADETEIVLIGLCKLCHG